MKNIAFLVVFAIGLGTVPVAAQNDGEGPPPHWEPVENARQELHDQLDQLVEDGEAGRIHELINGLAEAFQPAIAAEHQLEQENQERHRAIDEQFRQEHEEADMAADQAHRAADEVAEQAHRAADEARDQKHQEIDGRQHEAHEAPH